MKEDIIKLRESYIESVANYEKIMAECGAKDCDLRTDIITLLQIIDDLEEIIKKY